ncbi:MAG: glycosyltransferase family 39 protein [Candidatus Altiarchaeota archaeon]|nr:glycosyltransferase family 39 protein [Candidatus Altiarchaeota archaeon]
MAREKVKNGLVETLIALASSREAVLFAAIFLVYMLNPVVVSSTDATPARLLPLSIIRERDFDLDEFTFLYENKSELPYYLKNIEGRIVSTYPVFTPLLATPVYLLPALTGLDIQSDNVILLAKISAALMTAISCLFIYWTVKRCASEKTALLVTAVYAFGTSNWTISSQDLWQHGPGELFIAMSIYLLIRGLTEEKWIKYAGFTLAAATVIRPTNGMIAVVLTAYVLMEQRKHFVKYLMCATPPIMALMAYSQAYLRSVLLMGQMQDPSSLWNNPLLEGLLGLLASPGKGLLSYSPVFILSFIGALMLWRGEKSALKIQLRYCAIAAAAFILLYSKREYWDGCHPYGPSRYLIEIMPLLCILLAGPVERMLKGRKLGLILMGLVALSILTQFAEITDFGGGDGGTYRIDNLICKREGGRNDYWWDASSMPAVRYARKILSGLGGI